MQRQRAFTLIELLVVMVLLAIVAALAAPSFTDQFARRRLEGVATDLSIDLQFARTQAVDDRIDVRLRTEAAGTQYRIVKNSGLGAVVKTVVFPAGITATDGVVIDYEALRGTATAANGQITLASAHTVATMKVGVNVTGRVTLCSPAATYLLGYPRC